MKPSLRALDDLKALAIVYSAVALLALQFLRYSVPSPAFINLPQGLILRSILIFIVAPAASLFVIARVIAFRCSGRTLVAFRACLMIAALIGALRQIQLYWAPAAQVAAEIETVAPLAPLFLFVVISGLLAFVAFRFHHAAAAFFVFFFPAAVLITTSMLFEQNRANLYDPYDVRDVTRLENNAAPIYIMVFDELSYEALYGTDGEVDAAAFPNFARLAGDGLHLTNATTNYFNTWSVLPEFIDAVLSLSGAYEVHLYEQVERIERYFSSECGVTVTCRGVRHLALGNDRLLLDHGARALYEALPQTIERIASPVLHPLLRLAGTLPPPADPGGYHTLTRDLLEQYVADISGPAVRGRITFLHTLLPHHPFVFTPDGDFDSDEPRRLQAGPEDDVHSLEYGARWNQYRDQIKYADRFLGDVLRTLDQQGVLEDAVVIVTADHGMRLDFPQNSKPVEISSLETRVPFLVLAPGVARGASDIEYQHIDFAKTLYDLMGLDPALAPEPASSLAVGQARSLLSAERPVRDKVFLVLDEENDPNHWRYVLHEASGKWRLHDYIDWLPGDLTRTVVTND